MDPADKEKLAAIIESSTSDSELLFNIRNGNFGDLPKLIVADSADSAASSSSGSASASGAAGDHASRRPPPHRYTVRVGG